LGRTAWTQALALEDILTRLAFAPFSHQSNHAEQVAALRRQADALGPHVLDEAKHADELFAEPLAASPDDAALYAQMCQLHSMAGNQPAATAAARRAVELLPTNIDNWMLLGGVLATGRQFAEAADAYQRALQIDDKNAFAYVSLGRTYRELDRPHDALSAFRQALAADPRYGTAYLELGQQLEADGKLTEAEENYRLAIKNRIQRPADLIAVADVCRARDWNQEAAEIYQEAALLTPRDAHLHFAAGNCLVKLKKYAEARDEFAAAASIAPEFGEAHFLLAVELGRQQSYGDAVAHFREAVRLLPQLIEPRINLALTLKRAGRNEEALGEFRRALEQDPTNAVARQNIAALTSPTAN
jgi:tetratricopeptide (TPR) repeat protein